MRVLSVYRDGCKLTFEDKGQMELAAEREVVILSNGALTSLFPESMSPHHVFDVYSWDLETGVVTLIAVARDINEVEVVRMALCSGRFRILAFSIENEVVHFA